VLSLREVVVVEYSSSTAIHRKDIEDLGLSMVVTLFVVASARKKGGRCCVVPLNYEREEE
jgi:hypothetical protein